MDKSDFKVLEDLMKEYGLRARYNGGDDYVVYSVLDKAIKELKEKNNGEV